MKLHLILIAALLCGLTTTQAATAASYPAKTSLAGTEKVYLDDGGTDKHATIATIRAVGAMTSGTIAGTTITTSTFNGNTWTAGSGVLTIGASKTLTASNTLTFTGTDASSVAFGAGGTVLYTSDGLNSLASSTSAHLAGILSNETGTGVAVFSTSPTLVTPVLGVATATSINKLTLTAPATSATLTIADGKTLTASNTLTFTGTDASSVAFGTGGTVAYQGGTLAQFASTTSAQIATLCSNETGSSLLVFNTSPTLVTPVLGVATATSINKVALTAPASSATLTIADGKTLTASNTLTFTGTDGTSMKFPSASGTVITSSLSTNAVSAADSFWGASNALTFEGATADAHEISITPADATADVVYLLPDAVAASYALMSSTLATNAASVANSLWGVSNGLTFEGATADTSEITLSPADATADVVYLLPDAAAASYALMSSTLATNAPNIANSVTGASAALVFEGTADAHETSLTATDPTADRTVTIPNATGTVALSQASTTTALTADNQAVTPGSNTVLQLTSDDATATNRTFTLSATGAITGQTYVLIGPASNQCEIADTGIQVLSATWSPTTGDTLTLKFDGTNFIELARSNN